MRRWRTADDRFLVEGDLISGVQYYRLDRDGNVDRAYREERRSLAGELHQITFTLLGRQLMCRHTIDRGQKTEDQSRVELDNLEPIMPSEAPLERTCREAIARYNLGTAKVEEAKNAQVEKLAMAAPESIRPTFRRLAERVVFDNDRLCRQMISVFAALATVRKDSAADRAVVSEAAKMIELAARLMTEDPAARKAELPAVPASKTLDLVDALDRLRNDLHMAAADGDNYAAAGSKAVAYGRTADVLRAASIRLLSGSAGDERP